MLHMNRSCDLDTAMSVVIGQDVRAAPRNTSPLSVGSSLCLLLEHVAMLM